MFHENYIPKEATQQTEFLKNYPEFDGRGIKIAIIDSDVVDMNLPGFQKTSAGQPKIIDFLPRKRITVNTSTIVKTKEKKFITGLSGRSIKISSKLKNPLNQWHLGSVPLTELIALIMPNYEYIEFEKGVIKNGVELTSMKEKVIDCIVWFDGEKWRACIDDTFSSNFSNLENIKVLTNHDDENEFEYFANDSVFCVNISDRGNSLEIFCPLDYHGTTVTQVAAAYFPDDPKASGLAPGAQIISMNWDNFEEALYKCIEHKVDIVNFSCILPLKTCVQIKEIIKKMVEEHGIIFIQGAGNDGPFYSTIEEQYSIISDQMFFIGSIFTADVIGKFESEESINQVQNFSSRGPLPSGARGNDFVVPGAAITNNPKWYPNKSDSHQGTSCATSNAAGSIACLLSALKANSIKYTPAMIKMALAHTAFLPKGATKLSYGHGIIQINDAFEFIKKSINILPIKSLAPIFMNNPNQKGILHIQNDKINISSNIYTVNIDPSFDKKWILKHAPIVQSFVTHDETIINDSFNVKIDTSLLEEGSINYAEIQGYNSLNPSIGPLFYLPITIIYPAFPESFEKEINLEPGPPSYLFFKCPSDFQQYSIKISSLEGKTYTKIIMENFQKCSNVRGKNVLKFNAKKKTKTLSLKIEKDEELFQICFYHTHLSAVKFKMNIHCQKSIS